MEPQCGRYSHSSTELQLCFWKLYWKGVGIIHLIANSDGFWVNLSGSCSRNPLKSVTNIFGQIRFESNRCLDIAVIHTM